MRRSMRRGGGTGISANRTTRLALAYDGGAVATTATRSQPTAATTKPDIQGKAATAAAAAATEVARSVGGKGVLTVNWRGIPPLTDPWIQQVT
ncbi:hypothetical protein E2C01_057004 [Portunus trituberculatus]|uniref:Uncharacterized protein n=1 Tax=Portunus trituberculatus TaxID=210409 RepID=A0A5B7H256_PORTR|nr:hypothetical protein [Portunus trituberculatus]